MTPKEKAEELIHKMYKAHSGSYSSITFNLSRQCAKVAVDQIIENGFNPQLPYRYWEQVKEELDKL